MINFVINLVIALLATSAFTLVCSAQEFSGQLNEYQVKQKFISGDYSTTFEGNVDSSKIFGPFQGGEPIGKGPVNIAVRRTHSITTVPVMVPQTEYVPQVIEVDAGELPLILKFNSRSSRLRVIQEHMGGGGEQVEQTSSEDLPTRLLHEVVKPVIQEVREVITPYRRVIQQVNPVVEEVHTVIARGPPPQPVPPKPIPPPSPTGKLGISKGVGLKGVGVKGDDNVRSVAIEGIDKSHDSELSVPITGGSAPYAASNANANNSQQQQTE